MDTCRPGPRRDGGTSARATPFPFRSAAAIGAALGTGLLHRRRHLRRRQATVLGRRLRAAFPVLRFGGRRPTVLWCRARGADVVISLYCPAGTGFEELHRRRAVLSAVASVPEVHVDRHRRSAKIVTLTMNTRPWEYAPGRGYLPLGNVVPLRAHKTGSRVS